MALILSFIEKDGAVFDDDVTRLLGEAFDLACKELQITAPLHDTQPPPIVYEVVAMRIIEAAKKGERDTTRLAHAGMGGVSTT